MANPIAAVIKTKAFQIPGNFDTFSSFGVSLNSSLGNNAIGAGKALLAQIASDALFTSNLTNLAGVPTVGMVNGDGSQLDSKYRVTIRSNRPSQAVVGYLQDRTKLQVKSDWDQFIPFAKDTVTKSIEMVAQLGGKSLQNIATSRRMWTGTSPIAMTVDLIFEAITNAQTEVVEPCKSLLKFASPGRFGKFDVDQFVSMIKNTMSSGLEAVGSAVTAGTTGVSLAEDKDGFFLSPPGPYPFVSGSSSLGDEIQINIGDYLEFTSVIINQVEVDFDSRIDSRGYPISAKASVHFETYQVLAKSDLDKAFGSVNKSSSFGYVKSLVANAAGIV